MLALGVERLFAVVPVTPDVPDVVREPRDSRLSVGLTGWVRIEVSIRTAVPQDDVVPPGEVSLRRPCSPVVPDELIQVRLFARTLRPSRA